MRSLTRSRVTVVVTGCLLVLLIVVPVGFVLLSAFMTTTPRPGSFSVADLTMRNFRVLADPGMGEAIGNSLVIGVSAGAIACAVGAVLAFLAARSSIRPRGLVYFIGIAPLFLPSYVGALAWSMLGSPQAGLLNILGRSAGADQVVNVYGLGGVIAVLGLYNAPYAFSLVYGALSLMNPDLEEAANSHGASPRRVIRYITLPMVRPALAGAFLLVATISMENFPVVQMIGSPAGVETLPTVIFRLMNATPVRGNDAAAIALVLTAVLLLATAVQRRLATGTDVTTVTGKGVRAKQFEIGRWAIAAWISVGVYALLTLVLPLLALLFGALRTSPFIKDTADLLDPSKLSGRNFQEVLNSSEFGSATVNSIVVSILAAAIGVALSFVVAYLAYRSKAKRWAAVLEFISMSPLAVPAIVLGMGLLWTYLILPIPIYGTLVVLVVAFVAAQMPQGLRGIAASINQVHPELEEAVLIHGGRRASALWTVMIPLMRASLTSTFLLLLMLSMRELTVPLFLFTSDTRLLSIVIYDYYEAGYSAKAATVSVLYSVIIVALAVGSQLLAGRSDRRRATSEARVAKNASPV